MSFTKKYVLLFLLGFACYIPFMLGGDNSWFDETFSLFLMGYSWSDMFEVITKEDGHPPLFYILLRIWMSLTNFHNVAWARRLGLVYLSLTAGLGAFPVRRLCGDKVALLYTPLVFFFPTFIYLTTDMRMYGLVAFETTAVFVYTLLILMDHRLSDWIKLGLFSIALLYTHYYGGFILLVLYGYLFLNLVIHFKQNKQELVRFFITSFIVASSFLPWFILVFLGQTTHMYENWYPTQVHMIAAFGQMFEPDVLISYDPISSLICYLCCGVLWTLLLQNLLDQKNRQVIPTLSCILYFGVLCLTLLVSIYIRPMMNARYMEPFAGILILGLSVLLAKETRFQKLFFILVGIAFYVCAMQRAFNIYFPFYPTLKKQFHNMIDPEKSVILCDGSPACMSLAFYFPEYQMRYIPTGQPELLIPERLFYQNQMTYEELRKKDLYEFIVNFSTSGKHFTIRFVNPYSQMSYRLKKLTPAEIDGLLSENPEFPD